MSAPAISPALTSIDLCQRWRRATERAGWNFWSDWYSPAVDAVCEAVVEHRDLYAAGDRLGRDRAALGVPLGETLADLDQLGRLIPDEFHQQLQRAVSLGWADRITAPPAVVTDPLTGLATAEYLQVRLGELYRAAECASGSVTAEHALVVIRLDLRGRYGWARSAPMILTADGLRTIFDGGQSLVQLDDQVAVVLTARDDLLARRARMAVALIASRLAVDPEACIRTPQVWIENLPAHYSAALDLISGLTR